MGYFSSYFIHNGIWGLFSRGGNYREEDKRAKNAKITPTQKFPKSIRCCIFPFTTTVFHVLQSGTSPFLVCTTSPPVFQDPIYTDCLHGREQHLCFILGFTPVDRKGRSAAHFPLRQTWRFQLPYHKHSVPEQQHSIFASLWRFYLTAHTVCHGLLFLWMFYSEGGTTFI